MSGHSKWNNIKNRKEKSDAEKSRYFSKISREISVAVKLGGADPNANTRLRVAIQKAKSVNMPTDKINSVIKKNSEADNTQYFDLNYEGYGVGGVAVVVKCLTDNKNRTSSDVRFAFEKFGGSLGGSGCVSYLFDNRGIIEVEKNANFDDEKAVDIAIENNAIDFDDDEVFVVVCEPSDIEAMSKAYSSAGFNVLTAENRMIAQNYVTLSESQLETFNKMIDKLEDNEDVQEVVHNLEEI